MILFAHNHCVLLWACQHRVAHIAYPSHFQQRLFRVTADDKHVLTFGWYRAVTATA